MNRTVRTARGTADVCAQNENPTDPTIGALLPLARLLAPLVAAELSSGEAWIDQHGSPLGRRRHCELARSGAFPARCVGRRWLARPADVDAYIGAQRGAARLDVRPANDAAPAADEGEEPGVRAVLGEHGLEMKPPAARRKRAAGR